LSPFRPRPRRAGTLTGAGQGWIALFAGGLLLALLFCLRYWWREGHNRRQRRETAVLLEIGRLVSSTLAVEEIYDRFAGEVRPLIPFDRLGVSLLDHDREVVRIAYVTGVPVPARTAGTEIPYAGSLGEAMSLSQHGLLLNPGSEAELASRFPPWSTTTASACVPFSPCP
jgi:hypothetical protein